MKRNCNFQTNPALSVGLVLMWIGVFTINVLELEGVWSSAAHFLCGAGVGTAFVGRLYGSPKTRPLFDKFHAFKTRLLGHDESN